MSNGESVRHMLMKNTVTPLRSLITAALLLPSLSQAAIVFFDDFSGANGNFLHGTTPDTNTLGTSPTATWLSTTTVGTTIQADGAVASTGTNVDRGAWINLGSGFMQANQIYTLTLDYSNLANAVLYFGFQNVASPNLELRGQNQGDPSVGLRVREISNGRHVSAYLNTGGTNGSEGGSVIATDLGAPAISGSYQLIIESNGLADATATIGNATINFDATNLNHLFIAFEDNGDNSTGTFNSISIDQVAASSPIPEPASTAVLGAILSLSMLRRQRRF